MISKLFTKYVLCGYFLSCLTSQWNYGQNKEAKMTNAGCACQYFQLQTEKCSINSAAPKIGEWKRIDTVLSQRSCNEFVAAEATRFLYWVSVGAVMENHKAHLAMPVWWRWRALIYMSQGDPEPCIEQLGEQLMCINCICNRFGHWLSGSVTVMNVWVLMCDWSMADSFWLLEQVSSHYLLRMRTSFHSVSST